MMCKKPAIEELITCVRAVAAALADPELGEELVRELGRRGYLSSEDLAVAQTLVRGHQHRFDA